MACMRYVVTGGTGFIGRRVVSRLLAARPDAEVWVLVRRSSLGRFEQLAAEWGNRAKPLVGELTEPGLGLNDEATLNSETSTTSCIVRRSTTSPPANPSSALPTWKALRPSSTWHADSMRRCITCRRSRWPATSAASTPKPTSTSASSSRRRITRRSSRPNCWCVRHRGCDTGSTGRRWWSAIHAPARWTRSTGRITSSACWPNSRCCHG